MLIQKIFFLKKPYTNPKNIFLLLGKMWKNGIVPFTSNASESYQILIQMTSGKTKNTNIVRNNLSSQRKRGLFLF